MKKNPDWIISQLIATFFIGLVFFSFSTSVSAFTTRTGKTITIPAEETINETLLITGTDVVIDGTVNGDIFCAGRRVEINGTVDGDVLCVGQSVTVKGTVNGDVRVAGQNLMIGGVIKNNAMVFGQSVISDAFIDKEIFIGGQDADISGRIGKNLLAAGQSVRLNGEIIGNADVTGENLNLGRFASIKGNLTYISDNKLTRNSGALIAGKTILKPLPKERKPKGFLWPKALRPISLSSREVWWASLLKSILVNLVIGLILAFFLKDRLTRTVDYIMTVGKRARSMGVGLLVLFLTPFAIVVFAITIVGIPVAILLAIVYGFAIAISRIVTAMAVGRRLTADYWKGQKNSLLAATLLGVVVSWLVFAIPGVGKVFSFIAILWGLGGVYYFIRPESKKVK